MQITARLLTDGEAAELLAVPVRRLRQMADDNRIPHVRLPGGDLRFDAADLARWIQSRKQKDSDLGQHNHTCPADYQRTTACR